MLQCKGVAFATPLVHNANVMNCLRKLLFLLFAIPLGFGAGSAIAMDIGAPAPGLSLPTATGETVALDKLRGKVVYVDFWASWCGPCRKSFPWMADMQRKYGPAGLAVVAVNVDKKRPDAEKFLQTTPAQFTVIYDPTGAAPAAWNVKSMPSSFLIDSKGNVALIENGFRESGVEEVENRIKLLVGTK